MSLGPHGDPTAKVALDPELISVRTVDGSMYDLPDTAESADARVAVLMEFYGAEEYGHRLGDGASLFLMHELFGLVSQDTQFIGYRLCLNNCLPNRFCSGVLHGSHERRWEWCENDLQILLASHERPSALSPLQFLESTCCCP